MVDTDVIIVGAGVSGLACGRILHQNGISFTILEAADGVGGRVRTDEVDGYRLDRGFQVLLTAYPEAQEVLDYEALDLQTFYPGAMIRYQERFHKLGDPLRRPLDIFSTALAPVGSLFDKWYILRLRNELRHLSLEEIFRRPERPTMEALHDLGFSDAMIQRFFQPFLGGIFFDYDLTTSSRMFEFVYKMFSFGETAVPAQGMEAIPRQMASQLPAESIRLNTQVTSVSPGKVRLASGEELEAKAIVLATEGTHLTELVEGEFEDFEIPESQSVTCLYFGADTSPVDKGILVLNGEGAGPVNNLVVMSQVAAGYAPAGKSLISITVLGNPAEDDEQLEQAVRAQLGDWYGGQVQQWQHLRTYRIPHGLPNQRWGKLEPPSRPVKLKDGLFVCGDHRETASLQGAMVSGRKAAEAVLLELARA